MKLRPEEISHIIDRILMEWSSEKLATYPKGETSAKTQMTDDFVKELQVEDALNKEVDQLLQKYDAQFESGDLDRRKMFQMVKNQLMKEKKIIL